jgi:HK97 family phage portal protein
MLNTKTTSQYTLTSNGTKAVSFNNIPQEAWTSIFGESTEEYYDVIKKVPVLQRGLSIISEAIGMIPFNKDEFESANIRVNFPFFLNEIIGDYLIHGSMFCILESNRFGKNMELRRFHPELMELEIDKQQGLTGFKRKIGTTEIKFKRDEIGHAWVPSREKEIAIGSSRVMAALAASGLLQSIDEYGRKHFKSGAINPTLVEIEDYHTLGDAEQERTRSIFRRMFQGGVKKAFEVFPVGSNTKVHNIGSPMADLAIPELTDRKREDICVALGVPMTLLFPSAANYATSQQDDIHFYNKTIVPLLRVVEGMLNPYFLNKGLNYQLEFREQEMDIFQEDESSRSDSLRNLTATGIPLVIAMEILGYDLTDEQWSAVRAVEEKEDELPMISEVPPMEEDNEIITVRSFKPVESIATHLDMWQRKAKKAYKKHGNASIEFESDLIPSTLSAAIKGHLDEVTDHDDISDVFNHAVSLSDHHHEGVY